MSAEAILQAAEKHTDLLATIDELYQAPIQLEKLVEHLSELEKEMKESKNKIKQSDTDMRSKRFQLEQIKKSRMSRIMYGLRGKTKEFEEKMSAKEQEYYNAVQAQEEAVNGEQMTTQLLLEARTSRARLFQELERYALARSELEALYETLFSGITPDYEEEDVAEEQMKLAAATCTDFTTRLAAEKQALELLVSVRGKLDTILTDIRYANGGYASRTEGELKMERARTALADSQNMVLQAQTLQPQLKIIKDIQLPSTWSRAIPYGFPKGVSEDTRLTTATSVDLALKKIKSHVTVQTGWIEAIQSGLETAEKELEESKQRLFNVRRVICERIINAGGDLPPDYHASA